MSTPVPTLECDFLIGQPVHVIPTTAEENPEQVRFITGINWEYRDAWYHGCNITLATADDIQRCYGQTDGFRPEDLRPAARRRWHCNCSYQFQPCGL